jgi:hypothetical protein
MIDQLRIVVDIGNHKISIKYYIPIYLISSSSKSTNQSSTSYSGANDGDAQKRFSNAKAISSDQFFNKDSDVRM